MIRTSKIIEFPISKISKNEVTISTSNIALKDMIDEGPNIDNKLDYIDLSNEMSNLISNIHGESQIIELLAKGSNINDLLLKKNINSIKKKCLILTKALGNMIELKRIEEKQYCLNTNNVNIVEIIDNIVINLSNIIKDKKIIFDTNIEEKIMPCDIIKLQRAMVTLLFAAVKYSKAKEIFVNLKYEKNSVYISVSFKKTSYILTEFFKEKMDKLNPNSLIDLSVSFHICKSIIELYGGDINLSAVKNETSFNIELPCENTALNLLLLEKYNPLYKDLLREQIEIQFSDLLEI